MKWWDQMPWSSFSECWALSQIFILLFHFHQEALYFFTFCHKGGVICISEVIDISPSNLSNDPNSISYTITYNFMMLILHWTRKVKWKCWLPTIKCIMNSSLRQSQINVRVIMSLMSMLLLHRNNCLSEATSLSNDSVSVVLENGLYNLRRTQLLSVGVYFWMCLWRTRPHCCVRNESETNLVTLGTESIAECKQADPLSLCFLQVTLVKRQEVTLGEAARLLFSSSVGGSWVSPVSCKLDG